MAKKTKEKMTKEEKEDWKALYEYVHTNVLGYDKNQSLSRSQVLRLKGLKNNKFMANNNVEDTANYSFKVILYAFQSCKPAIQNAIDRVNFKDEMHKFNYILKIVEPQLNDVYTRMKKRDEAKVEVEREVANYVDVKAAEFKPKPKKKMNDRFADLW